MSKRETRKQTKKYLRALMQDSGKHPFRAATREIKYGLIGFGRNVWLSLASTLVMTITLLILFVTIIASVILTETAATMRDKIDITIFLKPNTSETTMTSLANVLASDPNVRKETIEKNTSEKEFEIFLSENSDNDELIETVNDEEMKKIMISTMQSTIRFKVKNVDELDSIKTLVNTSPAFKENLDEDKLPTYDMNQAEIRTINSWATIAKNGGIILSSVFLAISILVIFNTIRMAIFSRREEIYMMKLVGASKSFIRGPFLIEAQLSGLISGIIAAALGYLGFNFISPRLESYGINTTTIQNILNSNWIIFFYLAMMILGIIIGRLSARLATKKYLRKL